MREILFRGKRIDNGEWANGRLMADDVIIPKGQEFGVEANLIVDSLQAYIVIPETVGQYTGLTDKNGKKIFEGDIVEGHCHSQWNHRLQRCVVAYERDGFEARHYVVQGVDERYYTYKVLFSKDVEVIGNIHDNPELLKGAHQ